MDLNKILKVGAACNYNVQAPLNNQINFALQNRVDPWSEGRVLGTGTFGVVRLWKNDLTSDVVAVKFFKAPDDVRRQDSLLKLKARCEEEVARMTSINHPCIVSTILPSDGLATRIGDTLHNFSTILDDPSGSPSTLRLPFICMEYCVKGDLRHLLDKRENINGLPEQEVRAVLSDISSAISYLHGMTPRRIIHRDIKPENIVIQLIEAEKTSTRRHRYKLSDLGLAKDVSSSESICSSIVGTKCYMAPEIHVGKGYNKTVDHWSFGLIAYEISCGSLPFSKKSFTPLLSSSELRSELPESTHLSDFFRNSLNTWLPSMILKNPEKRGRLKVSADTVEISSLEWLNKLLKTPVLKIASPLLQRSMEFKVKLDTKKEEVQGWIQGFTGILPKDQLMLTSEGQREDFVEEATAYLIATKHIPLYVISKKLGPQVSLRILTSSVLGDFLRSVENPTLNCEQEKIIWKAAFYHLQTQIKRTEKNYNAFTAFRKYAQTQFVMIGKNVEELNELKIQIRERLYCAQRHFDFVRKLDEMDFKYVGSGCLVEPLDKLIKAFEEIKTTFEDYQALDKETQPDFNEPIVISKLTNLFKSLVQERNKWGCQKHLDLQHPCMMNVHKLIALFLSAQSTILQQIDHKMKLLVHFVLSPDEKKRQLSSQLQELDYLIRAVEERRLAKLEMIHNFFMPVMKEERLLSPGTNTTTAPIDVLPSPPSSMSSSRSSPRSPPKGPFSKIFTRLATRNHACVANESYQRSSNMEGMSGSQVSADPAVMEQWEVLGDDPLAKDDWTSG